MQEIPEEDLEETRAALAPTLDATAAILPWVAKPATLRFPEKLNVRWIATCHDLSKRWSQRHQTGETALRPVIFTLYSLALESADPDCLTLGEALASCADHFEGQRPNPRLVAALSATLECLDEPSGLEHEAFGERARHFATRINDCLRASTFADLRSPILDRMFINEALEQVDIMREALAALPIDAYALSTEASDLANHAEQLELWGIMHLARQLNEQIRIAAQRIDEPDAHAQLADMVELISQATLAVDG